MTTETTTIESHAEARQRRGAQPKAAPHAPSGRPKLRLPAGACDAHAFVFGPQSRFPFASGRSYTPPEAPKEKLYAVHAMLGIERCVVVQSASHGFDNFVALDAIAGRSGRYRGIALVPTDISDAELRRLDTLGFCGARFSYRSQPRRGAPLRELLALARRLAGLGWHLEIHVDSALLGELAPQLRKAAVPVVIDRMGCVDPSLGVEQPAFRELLRLMRDPRFWIKISGAERISRRPPPWEDALPFARTLVAEFGDRALWGTGWPHQHVPEVPDDSALVDLLRDIAPAEAQRQALLVDNPLRLYRFPL